MHQQEDDSDASIEEYEFNSCIRIVDETDLTSSLGQAQLGVVRCTLAQSEQLNDRRKTVIFQTCTKNWEQELQSDVDSDSCSNVVASKLITTLRMKPVKHPNPYKVTWIDATSMDVQERCLIPI